MTFLTDERRALQDATRAFVTREVMPYLQDWEDTGEIPRSLHLAAAKAGLLGLGFPEETGGQGGDLLDSTAMQEAFFEAGGSSGLAAGLFTHGIALHVRCPPGTRLETTEQEFAAVEGEIRQIIPPSDLQLLLTNIGLSFGGVNFAFANTTVIGQSDGTIQIQLAGKRRTSTEAYVRALRDQLPRRFPDLNFYFENADIVGQVLNFGLQSPIDIQVTGPLNNSAQNLQVAQSLVKPVQAIPGAVDVFLQQ